MKKVLSLGAVLLFSSWMFAGQKGTWNGGGGDSHCGAKGTGTAHATCAKKCIQGGAKPVIVTDGEGKVLQIANPDAIKGHEGEHVKVKGSVGDDGAVHVDGVEAL